MYIFFVSYLLQKFSFLTCNFFSWFQFIFVYNYVKYFFSLSADLRNFFSWHFSARLSIIKVSTVRAGIIFKKQEAGMSKIKYGSQTYPWQMNIKKFQGQVPHMVDIFLFFHMVHYWILFALEVILKKCFQNQSK